MAYGAAGGAALLAVAMLVWGRLVHRGFLILIAAGIGFVLAGWICPLIEVDVLVGGIVAALSLGLLAIVLARVVWAMLAATLLAAVAAGAVVAYYWPEVSTQPATIIDQMDFTAYTASLAEAGGDWFRSTWATRAAVLLASIGVGGLTTLAVGLLLPRATAVCMSSVVGACLLASAVLLAVGQGRPAIWDAAWRNLDLLGAGVAGIALAGMVIQWVGLIRANRRAAEAEKPKKARKPKGSDDEDDE